MVDQLIDLRIALEALYLDDDIQGELSFRLATHAAWHLGENVQDRLAVQKTIRDTYALASRVLHGRGITNNANEREMFEAAQGLCRKGILKILETGEKPNWNKLILDGAE